MKHLSLFALCAMNIYVYTIAMEPSQKKRSLRSNSVASKFTCTWHTCLIEFESMEELMPHIKAHEECDGKMFRCDLCGVRYLRKKDLTSHNKKKHPIKEQQPTKIIELTPDQPFILKKPMPAETESMADTKKEIQSNLMHQASAFFEFLAARKPLTIIHKKRIARESIDPTPFGTLRSIGEESFKEIEHIYYCPECTVKIDGRAMYLNHLFQVHNYIYEPHTITCKKAH